MSKQAAASYQNRPVKKTAFSFILMPIGNAISIIYYLAISIFISTIIEWLGMLLGYWGHDHAKNILLKEFSYMGDNFSMTLFGLSAHDTAMHVVNYFQSWLIDIDHNKSAAAMKFAQLVQKLGNHAVIYVNAFVYIAMITAVRCIVLVLSAALFAVVGIAAVVDGLYRREIRKVSGGMEHAGVYHRAKHFIPLSIKIAPIIYLAWPNSINPNYILLPAMTIFYLAVLTAFATFKKHL